MKINKSIGFLILILAILYNVLRNNYGSFWNHSFKHDYCEGLEYTIDSIIGADFRNINGHKF